MTTPKDGCRLTGTMCECDSICEEDCRNDLRFTHGLEIEPAREEFSFTKPFMELAEEFRRLAAAELGQAKQMAEVGPAKQLEAEVANDAWERGAAFGFRRAAQMLEERLNG